MSITLLIALIPAMGEVEEQRLAIYRTPQECVSQHDALVGYVEEFGSEDILITKRNYGQTELFNLETLDTYRVFCIGEQFASLE